MHNAARNQVFTGMEAQRHAADQAGRPTFATMTPAQRAGELIARLEVAKQHGNKAAFLAAQNELKTLVEQM
jgi:hypothetical protein